MACDGPCFGQEQAFIASVQRSTRPGPHTFEGNRVMSRTSGSRPARMRLAFYGRTNSIGVSAWTEVPHQYRACSAIAAEIGATTQWFHDAPRNLDSRFRDVDSRLGAPRSDCRELPMRIADPHRADVLIRTRRRTRMARAQDGDPFTRPSGTAGSAKKVPRLQPTSPSESPQPTGKNQHGDADATDGAVVIPFPSGAGSVTAQTPTRCGGTSDTFAAGVDVSPAR